MSTLSMRVAVLFMGRTCWLVVARSLPGARILGVSGGFRQCILLYRKTACRDGQR